MNRKRIDWEFTNDEQDVEVGFVGPDSHFFVLTVWHEEHGATLVVSRDDDIKVGNEIVTRTFDNVEDAKDWARRLFAPESEEVA